ncbi:MAG: hypothetical protein ABIQ09_10915 [Jatrophihabitantaceae bacterium]
MAPFVQIVHYQTSRVGEVEALEKEMRDRQADTSGRRGLVTADRDHPDHYFVIVEFESYEAAMANSNSPDIMEFSSKMMQLCDGPPTFYNLDVIRSWPE